MTESGSAPQPSLSELIEAKAAELTRQLPYADVFEEKRAILTQWFLNKEYFTVGSASAMACFVTHPLDLVKVRFQLQGELRPAGKYPVLYRNIPQAMAAITADQGPFALYRAIAPAFVYQFLMNSVRALVFEKCNRWGLTSDLNEEPVLWRYAAACALSGSAGAVVASTAYL